MYEKGRKKETVRFALAAGDHVKKVTLYGDFTNWQLARMRRQKNGAFVAVVPLTPGVYEYKFEVDGQWVMDPDNSDRALNPYGTLNSVAVVKP